MIEIKELNDIELLFNSLSTYRKHSEDLIQEDRSDVANAVNYGTFKTGLDHFKKHGQFEFRRLQQDNVNDEITNLRKKKMRKIAKVISNEYSAKPDEIIDTLTDSLKELSGIEHTDNVSSNSYNGEAINLINKHADGLILDCGCGFRDIYFDNVVNYEIKKYSTTDVLGVAESLPFKDNSFDAVFSFAVLEHVKLPWVASQELIRVLKPGGDLIVNVPFLQPLHGYPHHYFNMTHMGVNSLFEKDINIASLTVPNTMGPIWTLTWFLRSWLDGLEPTARKNFMKMTVGSLIDHPSKYLNEDFVEKLEEEKNFELASGTLLVGKKK